MKSEQERKRKILVCCGPGCLAVGGKEILQGLRTKIVETGAEIEVESVIKGTGCHGLCEQGPMVRFLPEDISYCRVGLADIDEIIAQTVLQHNVVKRLLFMDAITGRRVSSQSENSFYKKQLKIALRNTGEIDPLELDDYLERGGYRALTKAISQKDPGAVIAEVEQSGLRGRGGAGFPTGLKWRQCARVDNFPKYVICNADEGDPGAFMDRSIIEGDPHSVIEGMVIGAYAIKANRGFIYIRDEYDLAVKTMLEAVRQAEARGYLGSNILDSGFDFNLEVVRGGGAFVCGESSALMASIEGRVGEPRAKYIRSVERGLWDQPTVLNNVETWANIPPIILNGGDRFSSIGSGKSKGTKVFSLGGKVKNTGLVEVPMGITLRELIFDIGGGILNDKKFKAVQTGGPSGGCIPADMLDLKVDFDSLAAADSMMGSGGMIVMDERTCMVDTARYYIDFLAEESCGKCSPCREGLKRMREILNDICSGSSRPGDIELLEEIAGMVRESSLCGLGKTAPNPVLSTIKYFRDEYDEHVKKKRCPAGVCRQLTTFIINSADCTGCGLCKKNCPAEAIAGDSKEPHVIEPSRCTKCGNCIELCRFNAITVK